MIGTAKYTLRYLPVAQDDLLSIFDWIAQDSPTRAVSFVEKLDKRIGLLEKHPHLGRLPRYPKLKEFGYRVLIVIALTIFSGYSQRWLKSATATTFALLGVDTSYP